MHMIPLFTLLCNSVPVQNTDLLKSIIQIINIRDDKRPVAVCCVYAHSQTAAVSRKTSAVAFAQDQLVRLVKTPLAGGLRKQSAHDIRVPVRSVKLVGIAILGKLRVRVFGGFVSCFAPQLFERRCFICGELFRKICKSAVERRDIC